MSYISTKPDYRSIWASEGTSVEPEQAKQTLGWTEEVPPFEYFNWKWNNLDSKAKYLMERGIAQWDNVTDYPANAKVQYLGNFYTAQQDNSNITPSVLGNTSWLLDVSNKRFSTDTEAYAGTSADVVLNPANLKSMMDSTNGFNINKAVLTTLEVSSEVGKVYTMPVNKVPTNHLACNGGAYSRTTYASLFAVIGTTFGAGNGSTTFNVPDYRGVFLRGNDDGRGLDAGRAIGTYQSDAIRNITGYHHSDDKAVDYGKGGAFNSSTSNTRSGSDGGGTGSLIRFDASLVVPTAAENRPVNVSVLYVIRYK